MTISFDTPLYAKTARSVSAGFDVRAGRVGSPVVIAMTGGAAVAHAVRMADGNAHALAARCAG